MIIKAAVRSLRRQHAPEILDAASSIDEEVNRINHVVTDVLDFARPIRFELATVDLNALCREAALAAQAGPGRLTAALLAAGFTTARVAAETPYNLLIEARQ